MTFWRRLRASRAHDPSAAGSPDICIGGERLGRFLACACDLARGRAPATDEVATWTRSLRSGELDLVDWLEALRAQATANRTTDDYRSDPEMARFLTPEVLRRSEELAAGAFPLARTTYETLFRSHFESGRELVIGQAAYGPDHKERFWELFNAAVWLLEGRAAPCVLEFGTSEFSAFFRTLLPGVVLDLCDRPTPPDYIGFTEARARRTAGCRHYFAVDLEGGAAAIRASDLTAGGYDLVLFAEVLEHLDVNPVDLLGALLGLLKPDGYLYLTTPNFLRRENLRKLARGENPQEVYPAAADTAGLDGGTGDGNWDRHHHHREYAAKELLRFIAAAGGQTRAFYFSACWDTEPLPPVHERGNLVFVVAPAS